MSVCLGLFSLVVVRNVRNSYLAWGDGWLAMVMVSSSLSSVLRAGSSPRFIPETGSLRSLLQV